MTGKEKVTGKVQTVLQDMYSAHCILERRVLSQFRWHK